jgi:monofunctional glycosyltransferase
MTGVLFLLEPFFPYPSGGRLCRPGPAAGLLALAAILFGTWLVWPPALWQLRTHNPTTTRLMEIRRQQAARKHRPYRVRQTWVPLERISLPLRQAVVLAEDDAFYRHSGVDYYATWISLKEDVKHRGFVQGGSTITQQVVKNLYLSPRKSLGRKLKEAVLALEMEQVLSKRRILEIYLNIAEWGRGVYGVEAASRVYFGKAAAEVTLEEAAALVAVLPSPLRHSPLQQDAFLRWRKPWVLRQMAGSGYASGPGVNDAGEAADVLPPAAETAEDEMAEAEDTSGTGLQDLAADAVTGEPAAVTTTAAAVPIAAPPQP